MKVSCSCMDESDSFVTQNTLCFLLKCVDFWFLLSWVFGFIRLFVFVSFLFGCLFRRKAAIRYSVCLKMEAILELRKYGLFFQFTITTLI